MSTAVGKIIWKIRGEKMLIYSMIKSKFFKLTILTEKNFVLLDRVKECIGV